MPKLETILQIAPVGRDIRSDLRYGGTSRAVIYLDREFTRLGYNSIVAATGDSDVSGKLIPTIPHSTIHLKSVNGDNYSYGTPKEEYLEIRKRHYQEIMNFILEYKNIDIIHDHSKEGLISFKEFMESKDQIVPVLITLHRDSLEKHSERYLLWHKIALEKGNIYFNAISQSQKRIFEENGFSNIIAAIHHGIPIEDFPFRKRKLSYLFSLGRISPEKGQDIAIKVAKKVKIPLIIGGEIHSASRNYWEEMVKPYLDFSINNIPAEDHENFKNNMVEELNNGRDIVGDNKIMFVGNLTDKQKAAFYGRAKAFIMPIQWQEPFGFTIIESMACGTPVLAYSLGSISEIIKNGESGIIIEKTGDEEGDLESMTEAVNDLKNISPENCRKHAVEGFSIEKEAKNYLDLYNKILNGKIDNDN